MFGAWLWAGWGCIEHCQKLGDQRFVTERSAGTGADCERDIGTALRRSDEALEAGFEFVFGTEGCFGEVSQEPEGIIATGDEGGLPQNGIGQFRAEVEHSGEVVVVGDSQSLALGHESERGGMVGGGCPLACAVGPDF